MACYHAKVMADGIMKLTIHDCKGSIQLHNDLNNAEQIKEAIEKLDNLSIGIINLRDFILGNYIDDDGTHNSQNNQPTIITRFNH